MAQSSSNSDGGLQSAVAKLHAMAQMQEAHNQQVHAQWRSQGYAYYRAIWVECAEMLDHYGWKWWKKQSPDIDQVKLELVDIWHFALSELLRGNALDDDIAIRLAEVEAAHESEPEAFRLAIEALAESSLRSQSFELAPFVAAMRHLPMSYDELFSMYVGKNVLNRFRQDNGYKTGDYRKLWGGREDNEHLVDLLDSLDTTPALLQEELYGALRKRYVESA